MFRNVQQVCSTMQHHMHAKTALPHVLLVQGMRITAPNVVSEICFIFTITLAKVIAQVAMLKTQLTTFAVYA